MRILFKAMIKNKKYLVVGTILLFGIPLLMGVGIKIIDYIPVLNKIPGNNSDWFGFWSGYLGAIIGVVGAFLVMRIQLQEEKRLIKKEKEPIVVIGTSHYEKLILKPGRDFFDEDIFITNKKKISGLSIPLINGGATPIFNIHILYEIFDHSNIFNFYEKYSTNIMGVESNFEEDFFKNKISYRTENQSAYLDKFTRPNNISVILPGKSEELYLPSGYMLMINYYMFNIFGNSNIDETKYPNPILKISLIYEDYQLEDKEETFYIVLGKSSKNTKINNENEETRVNFSLLQVNKNENIHLN